MLFIEKNMVIIYIYIERETYCGVDFAIFSNIESLQCTHKTNIILCLNYTSIFLKDNNNFIFHDSCDSGFCTEHSRNVLTLLLDAYSFYWED